jgi:hypothetical protein
MSNESQNRTEAHFGINMREEYEYEERKEWIENRG